MADVFIRYSELKELDEHLKSIMKELEDASDRADALEHAIGNPYGKDRLREAAEEFEDGWDDRRRGLAEDLGEVQKHVDGVVTGFEKWDKETADKFDEGDHSSGPSSTTGPR